MKKESRRKFIKESVTSAASLLALSALPKTSATTRESVVSSRRNTSMRQQPRLRFSVIGINHDHIHGQIGATIRGGGEFVSFYAKEPDLAAAFQRRYPKAKLVANENMVLEDPTIQVIMSSIIPDERAPLGVKVMQHGKDYLVDKPGIITLNQLAEVRKV